MAVVLSELKATIDADAALLALAADGKTAEIAETLNTTVTTTDIDVADIPRQDVIAVVDATDYAGLDAAKRDAWAMLLLDDTVRVTASTKGLVVYIWPNPSDTLAGLQALLSRKAYRSEVLGDSSEVGDRVTHQQVAQALAL